MIWFCIAKMQQINSVLNCIIQNPKLLVHIKQYDLHISYRMSYLGEILNRSVKLAKLNTTHKTLLFWKEHLLSYETHIIKTEKEF